MGNKKWVGQGKLQYRIEDHKGNVGKKMVEMNRNGRIKKAEYVVDSCGSYFNIVYIFYSSTELTIK